MKLLRLKTLSSALFLSITVSGCGLFSNLDNIVPDNTEEYRKAETMPPLDIPPDLSVSRINDDIAVNKASSATYSEFEQASKNPLASKYHIVTNKKPALSGEGENRHLVVPGSTDEVWQKVLNFWAENNISVARQDSRIGLMDTDVIDDYTYRIRVDHASKPNTTDVYLSNADASNNDSAKNEIMLRQLANYLGVLQQLEYQQVQQAASQNGTIEAPANVFIIDEPAGQQSLLIEQDYSDAWERVGRVLDHKGFTVEDRDRSRGIYFVHYIDPFVKEEKKEEGFFSGLAFWRDDTDEKPNEYYFIKLISDAEKTKVIILDVEEVRTSSNTAKRLLALIKEQLTN